MKYFLYSILDTLFTLMCRFLVNPWAPLFCDAQGYLPQWLKWVGTFDDTLDAGVRDGVFKGGSKYWNRVKWLNRNPGYGFGYYALGTPWVESDWVVEEYNPVTKVFTARASTGEYHKRFVWCGILFKIGHKAWNMFDPATGTWKKDYVWGPEKRIPFAFSVSKAK